MTDSTDPTRTNPDDDTKSQRARRRGRRKKVFKSARLVMGGGLSTIDCVVKDISIGGARVKVADVTRPGRTLKLVFPDGEVLEAEVVRDQGVEFGLKFSPGARPSLAPQADPIDEIMTELESPWLDSVLQRLDNMAAEDHTEITDAAEDLRTAYTHLKMLLERRLRRY